MRVGMKSPEQTAGPVLLDALALYEAGRHDGASRLLRRLREAGALHQLVRQLCPDADRRSDRRGRRIRGLARLPGRKFITAESLVPSRPFVQDLSARQRLVLTRMARGDSNRAIAQQLLVTENTIKWHAKAIFRCLKVSNRINAVLRARELGLV